MNSLFWIIFIAGSTRIGYLMGKKKGKKKGKPILGASLGLIFPGAGLLLLWLVSLTWADAGIAGSGSIRAFDKRNDARFAEGKPTQLYFYWGNSYNGIAVDLHGRRVYLSASGNGRWFDLTEIKHYGLGAGSYQRVSAANTDLYFITTDPNFPELTWRVNMVREFPYARLDRALKAAGNFHRE